MSGPLVSFRRAALGYGERVVLDAVDLEIEAGESWGVVGPNGAGKTTLLKTLLGLERPLRGEVRRQAGLRFGYVPQKERLDPVYPLTAQAVAEMGAYRRFEPFRRLRGIDHGPLTRACLKECGVLNLAGRMYSELSGGQRQRVLIARALVSEPAVLVLDEPLAGIDAAAHDAVVELLGRLRRERGLTLIMVGHRLGGTAHLFSHAAWVDEGRARVGPAAEMLALPGVRESFQGGRG